MQVIQFTLIDEEIRHNSYSHVTKRENSVIYVSTHDSCTGMSWLESLDPDTKKVVLDYLDHTYNHHHPMTNLFKYMADQPANTVIISLWDVLRLGKNGRVNTPGTTGKHNWSLRIRNYLTLYCQGKKLKGIADKSGRNAR